MKTLQVDATVVPVEDYGAAVNALANGQADVVFGERAILLEAAAEQLASGDVVSIDRSFTQEPIALAMALNNDALRLIVDRRLSHIYRSAEFRSLYLKAFGEPSAGALLFYNVSALPD
jgi:ABC-type amino acid transport substrate-binding protein